MANSVKASQYDRDEHVFRKFLDPYMKFSSGLFSSETTTLEASIRDMLDYQIDKAGISEGARVLEIGTGWGCLLKRLKERYKDVSYSGVSPSSVQNAYVRVHIDSAAIIHTSTLEEAADLNGQFDAIFISGTFCHIQNKRDLFVRLSGLLSAKGKLVIEDTFFCSNRVKAELSKSTARDIQHALFGWAEIIPLSATLELAESAGLKLGLCEDFTDHFEYTIKRWISRLAHANLPYSEIKDLLSNLRLANMGWNENALYYVLFIEKQDKTR